MEDDETIRPVLLSTIGRSGTFIIEPASEKANNETAEPVPPAESTSQTNALQEIGKRNLAEENEDNDRTESTDVTKGNIKTTNEIGANKGSSESTDMSGGTGINNVENDNTALSQVSPQKGRIELSDIAPINSQTALIRNSTQDVNQEQRVISTVHAEPPGIADTNAESKSPDMANETVESPDVQDGRKPQDVTTQSSPDVSAKRANLNSSARKSETEPPDISIRNGKTTSPDVLSEKNLRESPDVINTGNDDNKTEEESNERSSKPSTQLIKRYSPDDSTDQVSVQNSSGGSAKHSKPKTGQDLSLDLRSSLSKEKERPIPPPRRSVAEKLDQPTDKYLLLHKELRDRWDFIANVPRFQTYDRKTSILLQEQANRRLVTLCPLNHCNYSKTDLIYKVEEALKKFYNQERFAKDLSDDGVKEAQGLPTLKFLQWIFPALDKTARDLLFDCDISEVRTDK